MPDARIPVLDLAPEISSLWNELNAAFQEVLRSGHFIMGEQVGTFEAQIAAYLGVKHAAYLGVKHAIGLNSGTDALVIGLRALGIEPGDEVITTPFSFFATAEAASIIGATPVFVDIDPQTYNLDIDQVAAAITPRTRAIIPVHLYGHAADLDPLLDLAAKHGIQLLEDVGIQLLEDVAQAFSGEYRGRKLGTLGKAGAFSFFPSKNLGAYGDAGMLVTNDDSVAQSARMLRAPECCERTVPLKSIITRPSVIIPEWIRSRQPSSASSCRMLMPGAKAVALPLHATMRCLPTYLALSPPAKHLMPTTCITSTLFGSKRVGGMSSSPSLMQPVYRP